MDQAKLMKLGLALGACFAVYKFVSNPTAKTAAISVAAVIIGKQLPYVGDALA